MIRWSATKRDTTRTGDSVRGRLENFPDLGEQRFRGERLLQKLSAEHLRELRERGPALVATLEALVG